MNPELRRSLLRQVPSWDLDEDEEDDPRRLSRSFRFSDFQCALAFARAVGETVATEAHHPKIVVRLGHGGWGEVTVVWWVRSPGRLRPEDFLGAVKTDLVFESGVGARRSREA